MNSPWLKGFRACLGSERSGVQIPVKITLFFSNCLSQINIGSNISVAISLIANLLQLKRWKALVAIYIINIIISQPAPFLHSETQTNSAPSVLWFEINVPFDVGLEQYLVCKISDHLLTLFFQNNYSNCEIWPKIKKCWNVFNSNWTNTITEIRFSIYFLVYF
jgi:hypothetical protein